VKGWGNRVERGGEGGKEEVEGRERKGRDGRGKGKGDRRNGRHGQDMGWEGRGGKRNGGRGGKGRRGATTPKLQFLAPPLILPQSQCYWIPKDRPFLLITIKPNYLTRFNSVNVVDNGDLPDFLPKNQG